MDSDVSPAHTWTRSVPVEPGDDESLVETRDWRQASLCRVNDDSDWWFDYPQNRQLGCLKGIYVIGGPCIFRGVPAHRERRPRTVLSGRGAAAALERDIAAKG